MLSLLLSTHGLRTSSNLAITSVHFHAPQIGGHEVLYGLDRWEGDTQGVTGIETLQTAFQ